MIKNKKGFTLVELVIVIVIVGILSVISVPIYRGYVDKAMITEGKVLLGAIAKSELAYHVEHGYFWDVYGSKCSELDIDARGNKYFTVFEAESGSGSYSNVDTAAALSVRKVGSDSDEDYVDIWVYGSRGNNGKGWVVHAIQYSDGVLCGENGDDIDVDDYLWK